MRLAAWVSWTLVGIFVVSAVGQIALLALPGNPEHGHRRLSGQALEAHAALLTVMTASSGLLWAYLRRREPPSLEATLFGFCCVASLIGIALLTPFLFEN